MYFFAEIAGHRNSDYILDTPGFKHVDNMVFAMGQTRAVIKCNHHTGCNHRKEKGQKSDAVI